MNSLNFTKYSSKIGNSEAKISGCGVSCLKLGPSQGLNCKKLDMYLGSKSVGHRISVKKIIE